MNRILGPCFGHFDISLGPSFTEGASVDKKYLHTYIYTNIIHSEKIPDVGGAIFT